MPRKSRQFVDGGYYHLIARGNNRQPLFCLPKSKEYFRELLWKAKTQYSFSLFHYCVMTNHIHLLLQVKTGSELPKLMQYLLFQYSLWFRKRTGYRGHVWEGRYKSPLIENEAYLIVCGRYIESNPVRAGMVGGAEDYKWSSYRFYAQGIADPIIDENPYYLFLGACKETRQRRYQQESELALAYAGILDEAMIRRYF